MVISALFGSPRGWRLSKRRRLKADLPFEADFETIISAFDDADFVCPLADLTCWLVDFEASEYAGMCSLAHLPFEADFETISSFDDTDFVCPLADFEASVRDDPNLDLCLSDDLAVDGVDWSWCLLDDMVCRTLRDEDWDTPGLWALPPVRYLAYFRIDMTFFVLPTPFLHKISARFLHAMNTHTQLK